MFLMCRRIQMINILCILQVKCTSTHTEGNSWLCSLYWKPLCSDLSPVARCFCSTPAAQSVSMSYVLGSLDICSGCVTPDFWNWPASISFTLHCCQSPGSVTSLFTQWSIHHPAPKLYLCKSLRKGQWATVRVTEVMEDFLKENEQKECSL